MLAKAILPAQEIESGTVAIHVFVGKFGGVNSDANVLYSDSVIQHTF